MREWVFFLFVLGGGLYVGRVVSTAACDDRMSCVFMCAGAEGTKQGPCICEPYDAGNVDNTEK